MCLHIGVLDLTRRQFENNMDGMEGRSANMTGPAPKRSKVYLEVMRIMAICLVVFCHMKVYPEGLGMGLGSPVGWVHSLECLLARTAVPLFFMISGALLLGRKESICVVWKKRVLRMVLAIALIWLVQYAQACLSGQALFGVHTYLAAVLSVDNGIMRTTGFVVAWYLYVYMFLLMLLPLLRILAQKMRNRHYIYLLALQVGLCGALPVAYACITGSYYQFSFPFVTPNDVWYGAFFMLMGYFVENRCLHTLNRRQWLLKCLLATAVCSVCCVYLLQCCVTADIEFFTLWAATACMATLPAITLFVLVRRAAFHLNPASAAGRTLSSLGAGVFFVMLTENLWRRLFAPWFPLDADWSLAADARAWCHVACAVCCALFAGALLKLLPGFRRIL